MINWNSDRTLGYEVRDCKVLNPETGIHEKVYDLIKYSEEKNPRKKCVEEGCDKCKSALGTWVFKDKSGPFLSEFSAIAQGEEYIKY